MSASNSRDERSVTELVSDMTSEVGLLVRKEIELARAEIQEQISRAVQGAGMFAGAGVAGLMALLLLSFAAAWGLAAVLPNGIAFLIVGVVYALVAGLLALQGRKRFAAVKAVPEQTVETLKEDVQWAKNQAR